MKRFLSLLLPLLTASILFAQTNEAATGANNTSELGLDTGQQELREISVEKFEMEGSWYGAISQDSGYISARLFEGSPDAKEPIGEDQEPDKYVLGARVSFLKRGHTHFTLYPVRPIAVEGIVKSFSIWVVGRNFDHELKILFQDYYGKPYELSMGRLNHTGWKQFTVTVPPDIAQDNYHSYNERGLTVTGLRVVVDPEEASGTYYVYFDDLRAVTDLFSEDNRDADDMRDGW